MGLIGGLAPFPCLTGWLSDFHSRGLVSEHVHWVVVEAWTGSWRPGTLFLSSWETLGYSIKDLLEPVLWVAVGTWTGSCPDEGNPCLGARVGRVELKVSSPPSALCCFPMIFLACLGVESSHRLGYMSIVLIVLMFFLWRHTDFHSLFSFDDLTDFHAFDDSLFYTIVFRSTTHWISLVWRHTDLHKLFR